MKAITIWQPWASLLACGAKQFETRSWSTKYRGPSAIHAATRPVDVRNISRDAHYPMAQALMRYARHFAHTPGFNIFNVLPRGAVIATAELTNCWQVLRRNADSAVLERFDEDGNHFFRDIAGNELLFGDFTPGRYAWEFANMQMLQEPIPAKGKQGLWNWEDIDHAK